MQLIKPKSETLYFENCFCSESIGTSFYNFFTTVDMAYCDWWIIKVVPVVYPIECDIALITASHLYLTKIITLICLTLSLLLMNWWFHGCYFFACLWWCVCLWCLEPLDLTNLFGMLPEEGIKLLIKPYESTFLNLIYYLGWGSLRVFWIIFILLNSRVRASSLNLNSRQ